MQALVDAIAGQSEKAPAGERQRSVILEYVWFGDRLLCRASRCSKCGQPSFVEHFKTLCCEDEVRFGGSATKRRSEGEGRRRGPSKMTRDEILSKQGRRCFYCDREFGSTYTYNFKERFLRINWDHFIPFAYLQSNPTANWVAACNVCNAIKHSRIFYDKDEARRVISDEARLKGFLRGDSLS